MTPVKILATAALVLALGACSSSSKSHASTPPTTTAPAASSTTAPTVSQAGAARIVTFVVPASVNCNGASSTKVPVEYKVTDAARQELSVDGLAVDGVDKPSGTVDAPVHCDGVPHTVALIAFDAKGARTSQVKLLTTNL